MRPEKLDPALQLALNSTDTHHLLFVHTQEMPGDRSREMLQAIDARPVANPGGLYVADLSREQIDQLSEQDWVKYLRLSQRLRPG